MPPRHNVAPTQPVLTITSEYGQRHARLMKWAFLPDWVKDPKDFSLISSARSETIEKKPSFRNAVRYRRCIVPVSGFYEWKKLKSEDRSIPHFFRREDEGLFALAGIWEAWMGPNGEEFDGLAILTRPADRVFRPITDRLPVILPPATHDIWLDTGSGRFDEARSLLKASLAEPLQAYAVSDRVNYVGNDDASLTEPRHDGTQGKGDVFRFSAVPEEKEKLGESKMPATMKAKGPGGTVGHAQKDQLDLF